MKRQHTFKTVVSGWLAGAVVSAVIGGAVAPHAGAVVTFPVVFGSALFGALVCVLGKRWL